MGKMTYDEAIEKVLQLRDEMHGTMPTEYDYEKNSYRIDVEELADALGLRGSMRRNHTRAYAAVNIEVLHELRRRRGDVVNIAEANEETMWQNSTTNLFANKICDE